MFVGSLGVLGFAWVCVWTDERNVEMMTTLVFPAIWEAYAGEEVVYVQQDGAPGPTCISEVPARLSRRYTG